MFETHYLAQLLTHDQWWAGAVGSYFISLNKRL